MRFQVISNLVLSILFSFFSHSVYGQSKHFQKGDKWYYHIENTNASDYDASSNLDPTDKFIDYALYEVKEISADSSKITVLRKEINYMGDQYDPIKIYVYKKGEQIYMQREDGPINPVHVPSLQKDDELPLNLKILLQETGNEQVEAVLILKSIEDLSKDKLYHYEIVFKYKSDPVQTIPYTYSERFGCLDYSFYPEGKTFFNPMATSCCVIKDSGDYEYYLRAFVDNDNNVSLTDWWKSTPFYRDNKSYDMVYYEPASTNQSQEFDDISINQNCICSEGKTILLYSFDGKLLTFSDNRLDYSFLSKGNYIVSINNQHNHTYKTIKIQKD